MKNHQDEKEILVVCDIGGVAKEQHLQITSKARALADSSGRKVTVLYIGERDEEGFEELYRYGAQKIVFCERKENSSREEFCKIVEKIIRDRLPEVVLFTDTRFGKTVAAIQSVRFESGLTADCIDIEIGVDNKFIYKRAAINDSVEAQITCVNCNIEMSTIKYGAFKKEEYPYEKITEIEEISININDKQHNICEIVDKVLLQEKHEINFNNKNVVLGIGRGVKTKELRDRIEKLARKFHGELAGTRVAVEENLIEKERQIGQSGGSISPKVYVAFGISGATQHMIGIKNAETIIAINKDENASIFNYADYAIVEDVELVIETMEKIVLGESIC